MKGHLITYELQQQLQPSQDKLHAQPTLLQSAGQSLRTTYRTIWLQNWIQRMWKALSLAGQLEYPHFNLSKMFNQTTTYILESILSLKGVNEFRDDLSIYEGEQNKLQKFYTKWILSKSGFFIDHFFGSEV